tara:strand:+ start:376 stop:846 length:471 start_codon:yes stop_codon:yes gene_type:complete
MLSAIVVFMCAFTLCLWFLYKRQKRKLKKKLEDHMVAAASAEASGMLVARRTRPGQRSKARREMLGSKQSSMSLLSNEELGIDDKSLGIDPLQPAGGAATNVESILEAARARVRTKQSDVTPVIPLAAQQDWLAGQEANFIYPPNQPTATRVEKAT